MKEDTNPTPEEVVASMNYGIADLFEAHGATKEKVARLTARQLRAKRLVKVPTKRDPEKWVWKHEPDWRVIDPAIERCLRIWDSYPAHKVKLGNLEQELRSLSDEELDARITALERKSSPGGLPGGES